MDVRCARCSTEYEFDDALVSDRGTTVKCTNCEHQFKVYPTGRSPSGGPERWIVRKASGRELVFTSLRELQRAIAQRQVGPSDLLSRGPDQPPRRLEDIAELEPFFQAQSATPLPSHRTLLGLPKAPPPAVTPPTSDDTVRDAHSPFANARAVAPTALPTEAQPRTFEEPKTDEDFEPKTVPRNPTPVPAPPTPPLSATMPAETPPSTHGDIDPAPHVEIRHVGTPPGLTPTPNAVVEGYRPYEERYTDPRLAPQLAPRPSKARWLVGVGLLAALTLALTTVLRPRIELLLQSGTAAPDLSAPADPRVDSMLSTARKRFFEGDLEGAKEHLDKASVLAEGDPKIHAALARLEAARADLHWLALRLDLEDEDARRQEEEALTTRLKKVEAAVEAAKATSADDGDVLRARVDHLRLIGELKEARRLVPSIAGTATDPETAYVLAVLDLAEPSPPWPTIIERLRSAANAEGDLGRARAALVYALVRSEAASEAARELARLTERRERHPLLPGLERFVEAAQGALPDDEEPADPSEDRVTEAAAKAPPRDAPTTGQPSTARDFRTLLVDASRAKQSGELTRARSLYAVALSKSPGNVEAMAGLADVARAQGDHAVAARYYDQVLAANPSYLPALVARADMAWNGGDRPAAVALYRRVVQNASPGSAYASRASTRIAEFEEAGSPKVPTPAAAPTPSSEPDEPSRASPEPDEPAKPSPEPDEPHIDTTDLPGF